MRFDRKEFFFPFFSAEVFVNIWFQRYLPRNAQSKTKSYHLLSMAEKGRGGMMDFLNVIVTNYILYIILLYFSESKSDYFLINAT